MMLSGHQPVYLPGIIVLTKIALSDAFMFVGHCQYSPGTWHNRNCIRGPNTKTAVWGEIGPLVLTVPAVKGPSIDLTRIMAGNWRSKHLDSIEFAYRKRPFFADYFPKLETIINGNWGSLGCLNANLITQICEWLQIETPFCSNAGVTGAKTDMLISMCERAGADEYLSSPGETYVDREQMKDAGIRHHFLEFTHPRYDQGHKDFIENLSVIDLLFNVGPAAGKMVKEAGRVLD